MWFRHVCSVDLKISLDSHEYDKTGVKQHPDWLPPWVPLDKSATSFSKMCNQVDKSSYWLRYTYSSKIKKVKTVVSWRAWCDRLLTQAMLYGELESEQRASFAVPEFEWGSWQRKFVWMEVHSSSINWVIISKLQTDTIMKALITQIIYSTALIEMMLT